MNLIPWKNKRVGKSGEVPEEHPLARLRDEMDHAFDRFWRDPWSANLADIFPFSGGFGLRINLAESDNDVIVTAELPGVDSEDIDIDVNGKTLTIHGEKKQEKENKKKNYHYVERNYGSFHRSIQLPSAADPNKVDANFKNGILTVTLQKRPDAKPKRIEVKTK